MASGRRCGKLFTFALDTKEPIPATPRTSAGRGRGPHPRPQRQSSKSGDESQSGHFITVDIANSVARDAIAQQRGHLEPLGYQFPAEIGLCALLFRRSGVGVRLDNSCEGIVPMLCRHQFIRFESVGIQLQGNGWISMTEPLRNSWNRHALSN
jgi:hypothetical protein